MFISLYCCVFIEKENNKPKFGTEIGYIKVTPFFPLFLLIAMLILEIPHIKLTTIMLKQLLYSPIRPDYLS